MKTKPAAKAKGAWQKAVSRPVEDTFAEVLHLIEAAQQRAYQAVNTELVTLYWQVGEYISHKTESAEWGDGVIDHLARHIARTQPGLRGFTRANLFRMRQFYRLYRDHRIVAPLVRQLSWSQHMIIMGRCKLLEEREFYIRLAIREKWGKRELERQIDTASFAKAVLQPPKLSRALRALHPQAGDVFRDAYFLEFLGLPIPHSEADLHTALLRDLGRFLTELGRDFCFVGSEFPIQIGGQDFALDLLFFHRSLNCLVALELKARRFRPEDLGKINFYLEALDRDVRKPHENPAIGILLCASKDSEVVEYALSRTLSPALVAEYRTALPDKKLLQAKLREFYQLLAPGEEEEAPVSKAKPSKRKGGKK